MSKFKKICLGDYIMVKHGFAFSGEFFTMNPSKYILTTPGNFKIGGGFQELKNKYYIGHVDEEYILNKNDVIITMTDLSKSGDTLGYSSLVPADNKYLHNQRIGRIYFKNDNINKMFLYWLLRTPHYHNYIVSTATGSTVRHTAPKTIQSYECYIPETKEEQKAIADVLTSFDDKIELNNKIIKNLEDQAQSLYKHWFVDFEFPNEEGKPYKSSGGKFKESELGLIPENWDVLSFGDLFKIKSGYPFKSNTYIDEGCFKIITIKNVLENGLDTINVSYINIIPSDLPEYCKLNIGDILVSLTGNIGRVCSVIENNLLLNQRVGKVCCINDNYKNFINCILKRQSIKDMLISISRGTAQQNLSPVECLNLKLSGNLKIIEKFSNVVSNFILKNVKLQIENKRLEETRDYLLQKLMSGEIKVTDIK